MYTLVPAMSQLAMGYRKSNLSEMEKPKPKRIRRYSEEEVKSLGIIEQYMASLGRLPLWILAWFALTAVVCSWDASFILLRPLSYPGAHLGAFWYPYKMYITVDQRYQDINDGFVVAISLLNLLEVVFNIFTIYLHVKENKHTVRVGFTVSVMTFWKTVLYLMMFLDVCGGTKYRLKNTLIQEIFLLVLPNIMWVFIPGAVMLVLWNKLMPPVVSPDYAQLLQNNNGNVPSFYQTEDGDYTCFCDSYSSETCLPCANEHYISMSRSETVKAKKC